MLHQLVASFPFRTIIEVQPLLKDSSVASDIGCSRFSLSFIRVKGVGYIVEVRKCCLQSSSVFSGLCRSLRKVRHHWVRTISQQSHLSAWMNPMLQLIKVGQFPLQVLSCQPTELPDWITPIRKSSNKLCVIGLRFPFIIANRCAKVSRVSYIDDNVTAYGQNARSVTNKACKLWCAGLLHSCARDSLELSVA